MQTTESTTPVLNTVRQHAEKHAAFSQGSLRALIFNASSRKTGRGNIPGNGLESALVRIGRKVLIDEARFFLWVERQRSAE